MGVKVMSVRGRMRVAAMRVAAMMLAAVLTVGCTAVCGGVSTAEAQQYQPSVRPPSDAAAEGAGAPTGRGAAPPSQYDAELWSKVRQSAQGTVSIPDTKAGYLIDASGDVWKATRNSEYTLYGAYAFAAVFAVLLVFYLIRGPIKIDSGLSGSRIVRFNDIERAGHWLLAVSFIILAITGLNLIYGRDVLMPIMGKDAFATMSQVFKYLHNYVGFAFMLGLVLTFVLWVRHNFPNRHDVVWLAQGGGLLTHAHPPAKKFNAGQKILFWLVILSGVSLSLSGLALLFPYQLPLFDKTFTFINALGLGLDLPTGLTPNEEQQYATLWHGMLAIGMSLVVIAHIYIGSIGMQGAFDAMGSGEVDLNWAKEHHGLWADEVLEAERDEVISSRPGSIQPAE